MDRQPPGQGQYLSRARNQGRLGRGFNMLAMLMRGLNALRMEHERSLARVEHEEHKRRISEGKVSGKQENSSLGDLETAKAAGLVRDDD